MASSIIQCLQETLRYISVYSRARMVTTHHDILIAQIN